MSTKKVYFKSDFKILLGSETGWSVPFRLRFWTNAPTRAFVASYDGTTYTNCHLESDGRLCIAFDNHKLGLGTLMMEPTFYIDDACYRDGVCDEVIPAFKVTVTGTDNVSYEVALTLDGAKTLETVGTLPAYYMKGPKGDKGDTGAAGAKGDKGDKGDSGALDPTQVAAIYADIAKKADKTDLGTISELATEDKSSAVAAINEVAGNVGDFQTELSAIESKMPNSPITSALTQTGTIGAYMVNNIFKQNANNVTYFKVNAGDFVTIKVSVSASYRSYASVGFSENVPAIGGSYSLVYAPSADGQTSIDTTFTAPTDGYICIWRLSSITQLTSTVNNYQQAASAASITKIENALALGMTNVGEAASVFNRGKYVAGSSITYNASSNSGLYSIAVNAGDTVRVRGVVGVAYRSYPVISFATSLDAGTSVNVLLAITETSIENYAYDKVITANADGYIVVFAKNENTYGEKYYFEGIKVGYASNKVDNLPSGLKIQTFGDSITDNYWGDLSSWVNYIPDHIKVSGLQVVNSAVGGSSYSSAASKNQPSIIRNGYTRTDGSTAAPLDTTADVVVFFCGTNDYSAGIQLGNASSATTKTIGALVDCIKYVQENSSAKVLVVTPLNRYNSTDEGFQTNAEGMPINANGKSIRDFAEAIARAAALLGVSVLDLNAVSSINRFNVTDYSLDGLHPHRGGDRFISPIICKAIKNLVLDAPSVGAPISTEELSTEITTIHTEISYAINAIDSL